MDFSKLIAVISAFVLVVCLVLSMTTLVVLRNAVAENEQIQANAKSLLEDMSVTANKLETNANAWLDDEEKEDIPTHADTETFILREFEGKIAIYDGNGAMLHWVEVNLDLLPRSEREALSEGITVEGRKTLLSYLQDYMG